jgi:hypothetical protein
MKQPLLALTLLSSIACSTSEPTPPTATDDGITTRSEITPVTAVSDAQPGVFIPPFLDCRAPKAGESTTSANGQVCTQVSIAGATEPGKRFADYASCEVVLTQRPYYPRPPAKVPAANDPRTADTRYMGELAWAKSQIEATGCVCCHDGRISPRGASQWDIAAEPIWIDTLSDSGLALFAGLADSSVLGAYPADQNHGFDRTATGIPTTDTARMKALVLDELTRRGLTEEAARNVPPFGGPIYDASVKRPEACGPGEGIDPAGKVFFRVGQARYVYVLEQGSANPGVPPNRDRPQGTLWRLDVLPRFPALEVGFTYGTTPPGSFQDLPVTGRAPALVRGRTYQLVAFLDMGFPVTNCLFTYGEALATTAADAGVAAPDAGSTPGADAGTPASDAGTSTGDAGAGVTFGTPCETSATCGGAVPYCAVQPGRPGYCTAVGCKEDPSVCPEGWRCFDVSIFQPGGPSICTQP